VASKETIIERLIQRGEEKNSWAEQQIDRCMDAFTGCIYGERIDTSKLSIEEVADYILNKFLHADLSRS